MTTIAAICSLFSATAMLYLAWLFLRRPFLLLWRLRVKKQCIVVLLAGLSSAVSGLAFAGFSAWHFAGEDAYAQGTLQVALAALLSLFVIGWVGTANRNGQLEEPFEWTRNPPLQNQDSWEGEK